jgi:hypothetical protein
MSGPAGCLRRCAHPPEFLLTGRPVKRSSLLSSLSGVDPTRGVTKISRAKRHRLRARGLGESNCRGSARPCPLRAVLRFATETANAGTRHGNGMACSRMARRQLPHSPAAGLPAAARGAAGILPGAAPARRSARSGAAARAGQPAGSRGGFACCAGPAGHAPGRAGSRARRPECPADIRSGAGRVPRLGVLDAQALGPTPAAG